jgi:hypothetical protein
VTEQRKEESMTTRQSIMLFLVLFIPSLVLYFVSGQALRLYIILLAFGGMWSLWVARRDRKHLWTPKLHDIWLIQFLWCVAAVEGNLEFFYRHTKPTAAILLVAGILALTIKGVFNGEKYTIDQS